MTILTRQVIIPKPIEEAILILKSCAYHFPKATFQEHAFSMHCAKRRNGGYLSLTRITGTVSEHEGSTMITLEVRANLYYLLGFMIILLGVAGLIYCLVSHTDRWIPCLGTILLGLLVGGYSFGTGSELLDLIEHKLIR